MAPIKRKTDAAPESARPEKKHKSSAPIQQLSALRAEEPAFPRGGASILTPLEYKQIQIQARQDVLFEQSTGKKSLRNNNEDEENDGEIPDQASGLAKKGKSKSKSKSQSKARDKKSKKVGTVEEVAVRIEGLSYKVSMPGTWQAMTKFSSRGSYPVH